MVYSAKLLKDYEFVIIDDGSTDKTSEIIESYRDVHIRTIPYVYHSKE